MDKAHGKPTGKDSPWTAEPENAALGHTGLGVQPPQPHTNDQRPKACLRWGGSDRGRPGRSHPWAPLPQTASESQAPGPGPAAPWWPHGAHRPRPQRTGHSGRYNCPGTFSFHLGFSELPDPHPGSSQATARTKGPCIPSETVGAPGRLRRVGLPRVVSSVRHLSHVRPTLTRLPALRPGSTLHRAWSIPSSRARVRSLSKTNKSLSHEKRNCRHRRPAQQVEDPTQNTGLTAHTRSLVGPQVRSHFRTQVGLPSPPTLASAPVPPVSHSDARQAPSTWRAACLLTAGTEDDVGPTATSQSQP